MRRHIIKALLAIGFAAVASGQQQLITSGISILEAGPVLPALCSPPFLFFMTTAGAHFGLNQCVSPNTWALIGGGGGVWGTITGTLSSQADLNTALNARLNVRNTGAVWSGGTAYQVNDVAIDTNGTMYLSIQAGTNHQPSLSSSFWTPVSTASGGGSTPGSPSGSLQWNNAGALAGILNWSTDGTNGITGTSTTVLTAGLVASAGTGAGGLFMKAGGGQAVPAGYAIGLQAPPTVPNPFTITLWNAPAFGLVHCTNNVNQVCSVSPVTYSDTDQTTLVQAGDVTTAGVVTQIEGGSIPLLSPLIGTNSTGQLFRAGTAQTSSTQFGIGGGTAQAQAVNLNPPVTALAGGIQVCWLPFANNTAAAPTLTVSGLAAKPVTKLGVTPLVANDITTSAIACAYYDGTEFQLQNPQTAPSGGTVASFTGDGNLINNSGSTGPVTVSLANAPPISVWGNNTGSSAAPGYVSTPGVRNITLVGSTSGTCTLAVTATGGTANICSTGFQVNSSGSVVAGSWAAANVPLTNGGTNANLTASNGGIWYSTASAAAILAGTAAAGLPLLSGASTTPAWGAAPAAQKWHGSGPPSTISGSLGGDFYDDTTNHNLYFCDSTSPCTSVTAGGWTIANGGGGGSSAWSSLTNPTTNLTLSMAGNSSTFNYTSAVSHAWQWINTAAATSGTSQPSPITEWCGNEWHAAASTQGCIDMQFVPGNGTDAPNSFTMTHTGSATGITSLVSPGPIAAGWDGTHASAITLPHVGTTNGVPATGMQIEEPASATAGDWLWVAGPATGFFYGVNSSSTVTMSQGELSQDVTTTGSLVTTVVGAGGAAIPTSASVTGTNGSKQFIAATAHGIIVPLSCPDTSGSATAQVCNTSPTFTPAASDTIVYKTTTVNTGSLTINVNSLGAKTVKKWQGASALALGDLPANTPVLMTYDGTNWEVASIGNAPSGGGGVTSVGGTAPVASSGGTTPSISITGAAGQVLAGAGPAFTATPALGTDNSVAGTLTLANSAANAHTVWSSGATTTNTIAGFATVPTTGHIVTCTVTGTTCTFTDGGAPGSTTFSAITGSTNTTAAMIVGSGGTLTPAGGGVITATSLVPTGVSNVTGVTSSQSIITLATTPTPGLYNIKYNAYVTTGGTGCAVYFTFIYTDAVGVRNLQTGNLILGATTTGPLSGSYAIWVASGNVSYTSTVPTSGCGSGAYDVHVLM